MTRSSRRGFIYKLARFLGDYRRWARLARAAALLGDRAGT
jgi:hypothetical protein